MTETARFYCPKCGTIRRYTLIDEGLQCPKCQRIQPINSYTNKSTGETFMPTKKNPITDPDGSKRRRSTKESPSVVTPDSPTKIQDVGQAVASAVNTVAAPFRAVGDAAKAVGDAVQGHSPIGNQSHTEILNEAKKIASSYGLQLTNIEGHIQVSDLNIDESLGEGISSKEANARKLRIQRQNNQLEVRLERVKQKRKIVSLASEELRLVGDIVDHATVGVETASKMVSHQIAETNFKTNQSRLRESEELLTQQNIRTNGVIALTEGIRQEWQLKHLKQERSNERLVLEVEDSNKHNLQKRLEIDAFLLSD